MNVPGLIATTRNGYYVQSSAPPPPTNPTALKLDLKKMAADLGAAANSNLSYTGLAVSVHPLGETPGSLNVSVAAKGLTFHPLPDGSSQAEVTIMVASYNRQDKMIAHQIQEMTAHIKEGASTQQDAVFRVPAQVPPGATRVRVIVRDVVSGTLGTADIRP
jgi:hypothetical protein